ncbi:MAG: diguanylate cyclase [Rhizobiaceae bacterium]|nr:diguanylate cyclase [Rhizobiaceae bacterium]
MDTRNSGSGRRFAWRVVAPVVLAMAITVGTVGGFVLWATSKSDERALQRETHLVAQVIGQQAKTLAERQDYHSNWDEAVTALQEKDLAWIDENLATELYDREGFDRIYVLGPTGDALYAMNGGGKMSAERFAGDRAAIAPLVDELRGLNAAGALAAYDNGNSDTVPGVADISVIDGRLAYVGVTAIMSESGDEALAQVPGSEHFLVCVRFLDSALGAVLATQYFIGAPAFSTAAPADLTVARHAITDNTGAVVGYVGWQPDRPGALILAETLPAMAGALAVAGLVLAALLRGLRRTTVALEEGKALAEHRANHDVLTGLANRAHFNRRLEEALAKPPTDGSAVALLALDLDRFKQVNDTLGHEAGDQLLCEVGRRLTPLVADEDTVARLGGDEFAIIQRGVSGSDDVGTLSSRIIAELSKPFVLAGRVAQIGVSIGVVVAPARKAARELASKADIALYAAKASGRNTYRIFDDAMGKSAEFRDKVGAELQEANLPVQRVA